MMKVVYDFKRYFFLLIEEDGGLPMIGSGGYSSGGVR